jgi:putative aldouronate transport system substrate-binding protein
MKRIAIVISVLLIVSLASFAAGPQRTLRLEIFDRGNLQPGVLENGPPAQWIQKAFGDPNNIKIEWVLVPRPMEVDKLNLMMAAGDAPDLCFTYDAVLVANYANQGGLADLTKLLASDGKTLSAFIGRDALDYGVYGGKQYAIPGKRQLLGISGTWIRKDWLDKLGLPLPQTRDQWLAAVRAFRDKDPGKLGANNTPIGGFGQIMDVNMMYSFFKPSTERDRSAWIGPSSTKPGRDLAVPGMKDALKFANMLQNEGLLAKDWALWPKNDLLNMQGLVSNGYVGTFTNNLAYPWFYNLMPAIQKNAPDCLWVPIDPFKNAEGKTPKYVYSPIGIFNMVPATSKNADLVVKYLNWMADLKNMTKIMFGDVGVHYDLDKDGLIIPRKLTGSQVWEAGNILDRTILLNGRPYDSIDKAIMAQTASWVDAKYPAKVFLDHYKMVQKDGVPPVRLANPPDSLGKQITQLMDKSEEMMKQLIMAKPADFDAMYDSLLKEWLDQGARQVKEDMLKVYDAEHR